MSLAADSPVSSSSGEDFAAYLYAELDSMSSDSSPRGPEEEIENEEEQGEEMGAESESDIESRRIKRAKVEELESVQDSLGSTSYRSLEINLEASSSKIACTHPLFFGDMCGVCAQRFNEESGLPLRYIHKELRVADDEIVRLRNIDMKNLLHHNKLCLVLDLDHTLLNSTQLVHITSEEEYLKGQTDSLADASKGSLFMLDFMHMMTKLRPFVRTFLKEASQMFEMYIYTMGDRAYALEMAKLLDPRREYFVDRIISRDDGTQRHQKGLDVVLGQESAVLILDDTENAWMKHKDNLMLMERYHFFASSCHQFGFNCKSLSELKSDESESDGALASVLKVLRNIHQKFFDELTDGFKGRDVRQVLKAVRNEVLQGCKIVFSRVFPTQFQGDNHFLWKMVEHLGATCSAEVDPSVTHIVSTDTLELKSLNGP